jgi:hypothetical protein
MVIDKPWATLDRHRWKSLVQAWNLFTWQWLFGYYELEKVTAQLKPG